MQGVEGVSSTLEDPGALLSKVIEWLYDEKAKQVNRNSRQEDATASQDGDQGQDPNRLARPRSDSRASEGELALDKLERILAGYTAAGRESISGQPGSHRTPFAVLRKSSIGRRFKPTSMTISSDLEQDSELFVPSVEATLDNSKALAYSGGNAESDIDCVANSKDKENWTSFKREIVRLTHTLKLKRWKRVPIESGADISVERLSGALTNAVYVVSPPKRMPEYSPANESGTSSTGLRPPPKLLLRIYGPQVEHLIDRESELSILRRLAKKSIGPRLLGTFKNGRFEEFLYAHTLTPEDMRIPDTSKQIANECGSCTTVLSSWKKKEKGDLLCGSTGTNGWTVVSKSSPGSTTRFSVSDTDIRPRRRRNLGGVAVWSVAWSGHFSARRWTNIDGISLKFMEAQRASSSNSSLHITM